VTHAGSGFFHSLPYDGGRRRYRSQHRIFHERLYLPYPNRSNLHETGALVLSLLPDPDQGDRQYSAGQLASVEGPVPLLPLAHPGLVFPGGIVRGNRIGSCQPEKRTVGRRPLSDCLLDFDLCFANSPGRISEQTPSSDSLRCPGRSPLFPKRTNSMGGSMEVGPLLAGCDSDPAFRLYTLNRQVEQARLYFLRRASLRMAGGVGGSGPIAIGKEALAGRGRRHLTGMCHCRANFIVRMTGLCIAEYASLGARIALFSRSFHPLEPLDEEAKN
jgi:hypothetical protein